MSLVFGPFGVATLVLLCGLAALVLRSRPEAPANRRLALVLVLEGLAGGLSLGVMYLVTSESVARALQIGGYAATIALPAAYLNFLALVRSPLSAPLRSRGVRWALVALVGVGEVLLCTMPDLAVGPRVDRWYAPNEFDIGPLGTVALMLNATVSLFGLVAAIAAFRRAPRGTSTRARASMYALAFGVRDALYMPLFFTFAIFSPELGRSRLVDTVLLQGPLLTTLLFGVLLTYAILRTQIFDIDLRLKAGLVRAIVGGLFVLAFLVVSRIAANFLNQNGLIAGGAAVGLMTFAITPLQKAAERFAHRALPAVQDTPEYLAFKKLEVYQAAVESAIDLADGERARAFLDRLATTLSIAPQDRAAVERDVSSRSQGTLRAPSGGGL